ncbi:MAG: sugar phosphate isomerase/epimerase [Thermodesulfobacteriota bacterium]|jgi:sugar phosphate isomerase/epimerase|nr:MAG: sugar phosphate isomerase/epimerase [Thermodesulfobacteriota bacterium]
MKIGVMNNPRIPIIDEIKVIGEAGYDFIDLTIEAPNAQHLEVTATKQLLKDYDLSVVGHTDPIIPYAYPIMSIREACLGEFKRCAEIFARLDAKIMNIHPCYSSPITMKKSLVDLNIEALSPILETAKSFGLVLMLENFIAPFDTVVTFRRILKELPGLKIHLDFGHGNLGKETGMAFCREFPKEIVHVHFSDNRGSDDHHMPLGVGSIDWKGAIKALKSIRYEEGITLEVFSHDPSVRFKYLEISRNLVNFLWENV